MLNIKKAEVARNEAITVSGILFNNLVSLSLILALFCLPGYLYAQMPPALDFPEGREFDPRHPRELPRIGTLSAISENVELVGVLEDTAAVDVFVQGSYAYMVGGVYGYGLRVIDVSVPSRPTEVGFYNTDSWAVSVYIQGGYAYVVDVDTPFVEDTFGLHVIDVSVPSNPREVGFYDTGPCGVYVSGSYAYVAGDKGLRVIDISIPSNPREVGFYDTGPGGGVYVSGSYAYVTAGDRGLRVIDVSVPSNPREVGFYDPPSQAYYGVYVSGSYAYVGSCDDGLRVIDVSAPSNPREVGFYDTPGQGYCDVCVSGSYAYVVDSSAGLRVIDVSVPSNPREVGFYDTPDWASFGVYVSGGLAYVANGFELYILRYTGGVDYGIIFGVVRDASTSKAIPNAKIQVNGADSTKTDTEGKYSMTLLEGTYTIGAIAEGYVPFEQAVTVPGNGSRLQFDIQLYPVSVGGLVPKVCDVTSMYCDKTRKAYFLNGVSVDISFKAVADWDKFEPGSIRFVTPKGAYEGLTDTRTFDVGAEFGVGGKLQVIAVAKDGTESEPYIANFEVVPIPSGIPPDPSLLIPKPELNPKSGHVLKYGSSLGWGLPAIKEGVEEETVPEEIPGFGGKAFEFNVVVEAGVEITSEGKAKAWATKPLKKFEIAGCESEPKITAEVVWEYSSSKESWAPGGGICITLELDCTTSPYYFTIPVGPIPIPAYWRAGVEASLDTCVQLIGWLSESSPELKGEISLQALGKFILGVGVADVLTVEGELKGGPKAKLQFPKDPHLFSFVIHIEGTARVVVLCYKWTPGPITYDWELIGAGSAIQAMRLRTLPPLKEFKPLERDYLDKGYPMFVHSASAETDALQSENTIVMNEFPYSDPDLAIQNGKRMLVWLTDDPLRSDNNRTKALWSTGEDGGWTEPLAIDDEGTADFEPEVEMLPNGDALAAWVNCSQIFGDDAGLEDLLAASEITVAKYSSTSGSWESIQRMTNNSYLEHTPHLCVADDGTAMLVWISNPANHVIGSSTEPNQVWYSFFNGRAARSTNNGQAARSTDGAVWSPPALVADGVGAILKSDLAYDGLKAVYVYSADMDDDLTTEEDEELYGITYADGLWSVPVRLTDDIVKDANPDIEYTASGSLMLLWYRENRIVQSDSLVLSTFTPVVETGVSSGAADFSLAVGSGNNISLVWQDASNKGVDLWTATYDPNAHVWSFPYQLTSDIDLERNITSGYDSGKLVLVYNKAEVIETEEQISIGQSDLCWQERQIGTDLAISADDVSFSPANPVPGEECTITAVIHNLGDLAVENVQIAFYDGNPAEGGQKIGDTTVDRILAGSDSKPISIAWTPPGYISEPKNIYVVVDPAEAIPDRERSNNTCSRRVIKPDLAIQEIYTQKFGGDKISTVFRVINIGTVPAENIRVELRKDAPDGELLGEFQIEELGKDVFEDKSIVLDKNECGKKHYVIVDAAGTVEEFNEDNNVESVTIPKRLPGDVSGNDKITAYDASLVLQYVVGLIDFSEEQRQAADVTGNGTITALDAALILQYTVGLITEFPAQGAPILVAKDDNPLAPFIKGDENQRLTKIIAELKNSSLSTEQKRILEQLKHLLWQRTLPKQTALLQNYPNPFNPETWLPFQLAQDAPVIISIYNAKGQLIRTLHLGNQKAGIYVAKDKAAYWDGRNHIGEKVAGGIYFYTLQAGEFRATRRMVILK